MQRATFATFRVTIKQLVLSAADSWVHLEPAKKVGNCWDLLSFHFAVYWADDKQSKAQNSDSKYRQMALVGFDT